MTKADQVGVHEDARGFLLRAPEGVSYRVDLADGVLAAANPTLARHLDGRRVCAFLSPTVERLYGDRVRGYLRGRLPDGSWTVATVATGEENKTLATVERVCAVARAADVDKHGIMLAAGGGVLCDIVGFAASIYARGMRFIKLNTTLVGQVDAGVGVKTGVNGLGVKSAFGTFHPPHASINDPAFLATLSKRDVRCGLAEVAKLAVVKDESLFATVQAFRPDIASDVVRTAIRLMLRELCVNLLETDPARILDFGHTFSPVIEAASGYRVRHGEAVAIDIAISSHVARLLGLCGAADCERIVDLLAGLGLPVFDPETCTQELMQVALRAAWGRRRHRLNLVLPTGIGAATFLREVDGLPGEVLAEALTALHARSTGDRARTYA